MRELLWMHCIVKTVAEGFDILYNQVARIHLKVFEDNQGPIVLVKKPQATLRTSHTNTKYHHFKEHIGVKDGDGIEVVYMEMESQITNLLTKGLGHNLFE